MTALQILPMENSFFLEEFRSLYLLVGSFSPSRSILGATIELNAILVSVLNANPFDYGLYVRKKKRVVWSFGGCKSSVGTALEELLSSDSQRPLFLTILSEKVVVWSFGGCESSVGAALEELLSSDSQRPLFLTICQKKWSFGASEAANPP